MLNVWLLSLLSFFTPAKGGGGWYELTANDFFDLEEVKRPINPEHFELALLEAAVFHASNLKRSIYKKPTFSYSASLRTAARYHSNYMLTTQRVNHLNRKEKNRRTPFARVKSFNGNYKSVAENLARLSLYQLGPRGQYFKTPDGALVDEKREPLKAYSYAQLAQEVVTGWMKSPGHRENLMGDYSELGVGISKVSYADSELPEVYFTQNFGKP